MSRIVCTITSKRYLKYTRRLCDSIRRAGWLGRLVVLTEDEGIHCNEEVAVVRREFRSAYRSLNDSRWLQFQLNDFFVKGERVMYLDSDMICREGCRLGSLFDVAGEIVTDTVPVHHDVTGELPLLKKELGRKEIEFKVIMSPFVFDAREAGADLLFDKCKAMCQKASGLRRGTMFAYNMAYWKVRKKIDIRFFRPGRVYYAVDAAGGVKLDESFWFVHYGGGIGKALWEKHGKELDRDR